MSNGFSIDVNGMEAVFSKLTGLLGIAEKIKPVVETSTRRCLNGATSLAPVGETGELQGSGQYEMSPDGLSGTIRFTSDHAVFNELGTGRRGADSHYPDEKAEDYRYGRKAGMHAKPFLYPAFQAELEQLPKDVRDVVVGIVP